MSDSPPWTGDHYKGNIKDIKQSTLGQEINTQGTQKDELRQSIWPGNRSSKNTFKVVYVS
jgi:hypothetical protein